VPIAECTTLPIHTEGRTDAHMKNTSKRILSVKIKRMVDTDPDTSYLGEYSNKPESEFAVDRAHSEDCASVESNHRDTVDKLERIIGHLDKLRTSPEIADNPDNTEWESLDAAIDILTGLQDDAMECNCDGGDMLSREYRYFNPCHENYAGLDAEEIRKYCHQDYERMEDLEKQNWYYVGVQAQSEIALRVGEDNVLLTQTITSGGVWGIESDSDKADFDEVNGEQLAELKSELRALGFSTRAISQAFKSIEEVSE
jgi:hypothetical protein